MPDMQKGPKPQHTPGPWECVASTKHHGPYVVGPYGGDICDCYVMSDPSRPSTLNGGTSYPIHFKGDEADANAALIAAAPEMLEALQASNVAIGLAMQIARGDLLSELQTAFAANAKAIAKAEGR